MIKNYIKIAWRNLKRNKAYASISVIGLALGMACGILIFTLVTYHLSFDNFHKNPDRIYRFVTEWHDEQVDKSSAVPVPVAKLFRSEYTLGEKVGRSISYNQTLITINDGKEVKKFREETGVAFTEPQYFDILNFPLIKGDKNNVLKQPGQAIITQKTAEKYFGKRDAMGQTIRLDNQVSFNVVGILKNLPNNTDRKQEIYLSYADFKTYTGGGLEDNWGGVYSGSEAFTLLKPGVTKTQAEAALAQLRNKNFKGRDQKVWQFKLQPLNDIHFNAELDGYADKKYLWALFFIGLFLIITACVNFVNLATAQALNRSKEVGIRKVMGSLPRHLFWQFIAETAIITFVAVVLSGVFAELTLPLLNSLFKSEMEFNWLNLSLFTLLTAVVVIFLSGSYPGLVIARFQPIQALKSKLSQKDIGGFSLRRILVVTQFAISQVMIIGAIIVISQLRYSQSTDLGFNKNAIIMFPMPKNDKATISAMQTKLKEISGIEKVSFCYAPPASGSNSTTGVNYDNRAEAEHWGINMKFADANYLSTFNIKLAAGRNLFPSDTTREFLVNETFCRKLGLHPQDVVGKMIAVNGKTSKGPIVGVVKDFYNYSFHTEIAPICIMPAVKNYSNCAVKINMRSAKTTLAAIQKTWSDTFPDELYSYNFLSDSIAKFYDQDTILLKLVEAFACIAIIIGCLGLYGLVSFMAVRKTKEIGVRKVLGANILNVLWLFGKEFSRLLLIAFVIAAPAAWYVMHNYLQDFHYRITIGPGIFLISIASTFAIAAVTVGYRAMLSATTNPVKSLRSE